jgi:hypothetical protein
MSASEYSESPGVELLEARLIRVARHVTYPATPDLGRKLRGHIFAERQAAPPAQTRGNRVGWAVAGVVAMLLFLATLLVPDVRAFWINVFRIGSVEVEVTTPTPVPPRVTPQATLTPAWSLDLAGETTLEEARATLSFPLKVPTYTSGLGPPDRVFVQDVGGEAAIEAWTAEGQTDTAEMILFALSNRLMARKYVEDSEMLLQTAVGQTWGLWIRGPHVVQLQRGSDKYTYDHYETRRLVGGNTLLWVDDNGITYRLETTLPLEEAVRIAESLK